MDLKEELLRRKNNTARLLLAFKRKGELTTSDLLNFGSGMSSRLHELRKEGHKIITIYIGPGNYRYVYHGHPDDPDSKTLLTIN